MHTAAHGTLIAGLALLAACSENPTGTTALPADAVAFHRARGTEPVTVMTQNLYVGANVDAVIAALMSPDPNDDVPALEAAIQTLHETDFPARAGAFAAAIDRRRPDVVGFQEVSNIHIDLAAFGIPPVELHFLPIILDSLAARGLHYVVADTVRNIDAQLLGGAIELVDLDAVLVNADRVTDVVPYSQNFTANLGEIAPGVVLQRGFVEVGALIDGQRYWVVSTHLEPDLNAETPLGDLREAQAAEIVRVLGDSTPAFIMGDLNDDPGSAMYQVFQGAGFADVWATLRPGTKGYTDSHPLDLNEQVSHFTRRIDYVWARGMDGPRGNVQGQITRINILPWERVQGPDYKIWSSDHAGLVATLRTPANGEQR
jgi:endonuclease/exonuclease/phosphatase family metal-dependent hydrolase